MVTGGWRTSNQLCSSAFAQRKEEEYESANKGLISSNVGSIALNLLRGKIPSLFFQ